MPATEGRTADSTASGHHRGLVGGPATALVGFTFAAIMVGTTLPTPLYAQYAARFGFGEFVTTVVYAVYAVGVAAGLVLFGHWSDQLGRRPLLLAAVVLSAGSAVCFLSVGPMWLLYLGRLLSGISAGIATGTATATIVDLAPDRGSSRAGLVAVAVNMGGLGLGPALAGVLTQYAPAPLRLCFVVDLVLLAVAVPAMLVVRDPVERAEHPQLRPRRLHVPSDLRPVFVPAAIAGFAGFAVLGLFTAVSPAFLGTVLMHRNAAVIGAVVLVVFAASVGGQLGAGRFGDRRALVVGCALLAAGMLVIAAALAAHSLVVLIVGALVAGVGQGLSFRAGTAAVTSGAADDARGAVTSTLFLVLYVGISIPVIGVGALSAGTGLVTAGIAFAALVAVLGVAAMVLVGREHAQ